MLPANLLNFAQFSGNPNFGLEHKEFPHWIEIPGEISVHLEAPLPDGWVVDRQPSALSHQWKDGSGTRTVATANGRLVLDQRLTLGNAWIPPQDWDAFRTYLFETGSRPNNIFVFGTKSN